MSNVEKSFAWNIDAETFVSAVLTKVPQPKTRKKRKSKMRRGAGALAEVVTMDSVPSHISIGPFQSCNNTMESREADNTPGGAVDIEGCQFSLSHAEEVADTHAVDEVVGSSSHYQGEATAHEQHIDSYFQRLHESMSEQGFAEEFIAHLSFIRTGAASCSQEIHNSNQGDCPIPTEVVSMCDVRSDVVPSPAGADTESSESSGELPLEEGADTESSGSSGELRDVSRTNTLDFIHDLVLEYAQTTPEAMGWIRVEKVIGGARSMGIPLHESMDAMQTWCALNVMCMSPEYDQIRFLVTPLLS